MRLVVAQPEEADDDEEVDYLLRVAFDVEDEGVGDVGRWAEDYDYLGGSVCVSKEEKRF